MIKIKAILLCAGYATRLYPLTLDRPKPLLPIAGKPIIEHILERMENLEHLDEVFIITNNKFFNDFRNWKRKFAYSKPIKIINDKTASDQDKLGAVGDILFAINEEKIDDDLMVVAGDNLFKFSLKWLMEFFNEKKRSVIALYDIKDKELAARKYGIVELDKNKKIVGFEEKPEAPKTTLASTACYIFSREDVHKFESCSKEGSNLDNLGDFIKWLIKKKDVYGYTFSEKWFDIGSPKQLREAEEVWSRK